MSIIPFLFNNSFPCHCLIPPEVSFVRMRNAWSVLVRSGLCLPSRCLFLRLFIGILKVNWVRLWFIVHVKHVSSTLDNCQLIFQRCAKRWVSCFSILQSLPWYLLLKVTISEAWHTRYFRHIGNISFECMTHLVRPLLGLSFFPTIVMK